MASKTIDTGTQDLLAELDEGDVARGCQVDGSRAAECCRVPARGEELLRGAHHILSARAHALGLVDDDLRALRHQLQKGAHPGCENRSE